MILCSLQPGRRHEASTPPVSACGRERSRGVGRVARREGASLSVAAANLDGLRARRGTPDIIARLLGQSLSHRLGQSVVIDNRPGGRGNLALQAVARAPADGYTLLLVASPHVINVTLYEKSATTVTRDIVPVASTNNDSFVLLVNPSFPAKTVAEFIAYAKANRGKINLTSSGTGNLTHLSGELFRMMTGIDVVHVP